MIVSIFISLCRRVRSAMRRKAQARSDGVRLNTASSLMFVSVGGRAVFKFIRTHETPKPQEDKEMRMSGENTVSLIINNNKPVFKFLNR